jgi:CheY-like chemotaxis protein
VVISARLAGSEKSKPAADVNFNDLAPATLLVVDDNQLNCDLIAGMFASTHHRLLFAATGEEALVKAREIKPEIMLLDMRLPGISGEEVLAEIRKSSGLELMPIIAVTASALLDAGHPLKERFSGYVRKPFTKRELFDELAEFLPGQPRNDSALQPGSTTPPRPSAAPAAPELLAHLRQLVDHPWPSLRDSVAVNECRSFARELENLGRRWQSPALAGYAQTLLHDVENYDVAELENHLGQFATLVEQLAGAPPA